MRSTWFHWFRLQLVSTGLMVKGWFVLVGPTWRRDWRPRRSRAKGYESRVHMQWRDPQLYLYCNEEDGVLGDQRFADTQAWVPSWYRLCAYQWSALRNPVGNFRWANSFPGGPFKRRYFFKRKFYLQAGFRPDTGWPILSVGTTPAQGFGYGD